MIIKSNLQLILVLITKTNLTQNICPLTPIMILFSIAIIKYYNMLIYKQT